MIAVGEALGDIGDLAVVEPEVLDDLVDGFKAGDVVALDFVGRDEIGFGEAGEHLGGCIHGRAEFFEQLGGRQAAFRGEFGGTIALIRFAVERGDKPLRDVAVQMQNQVADAVGCGIGTPPDLLGGERLDTGAQTRPVVLESLRRENSEERSDVISRTAALELSAQRGFPEPSPDGTNLSPAEKHKSGRMGRSWRKGRESVTRVRFDVVLDRVFRVFGGVNVMAVGEVRVVSGLFVVARFMVRGGFLVVARSVLVVFRCLLVVMSCILRHVQPPEGGRTGFFGPVGIIGRRAKAGVKAKRIADEYRRQCDGAKGR